MSDVNRCEGVCVRYDSNTRRCYSISNGTTEERTLGPRCGCINEAGNPVESMMAYCMGNPSKILSKPTRSKLSTS